MDRRPTRLDIFIECVHLLNELNPDDRKAVVAALDYGQVFDAVRKVLFEDIDEPGRLAVVTPKKQSR